MDKLINQPEFRQWIETSLARRENVLAVSNQGTILHYSMGGTDLIVKTAMGRGLVRLLRQLPREIVCAVGKIETEPRRLVRQV